MVMLADAFARAGHDVFFVVLCRGGVGVPRPTPAVRVVDLGASNVARAAAPFAEWLRATRPDAVLATLVAPNLLAVAASRLVPRRPRVVVREANTLTAALRFRPASFRAASSIAVRLGYPRADAIVAVSSGAADDLAKFLGVARDRIVTIPNPASTPSSRAQEEEPVAHPWLAGAPGAREIPVVIAAGRLVRKKGFDVLLDAFARLRQTREARLVILGDGIERHALESRIATLGIGESVVLTGFVENPLAWFARADLFVLSSFAEGMPNALLQAMAAGCPVVATDCPSGPREILEDGRWGELVPPGDASEIANAIDRALAKPRPRSESRRRSEAFGIETVASSYAALLFRPTP